MKWTDAEVLNDDVVKIPPNWLFLHYYEALTILFRVENALRMFVYTVLKDEHKGKWSPQLPHRPGRASAAVGGGPSTREIRTSTTLFTKAASGQ
ncbi:MAG: hypothetical protein M3041_00320 [Acidobacteriota bacterium]|nr:hypothetical protein [Acidobacteriota bacterium]